MKAFIETKKHVILGILALAAVVWACNGPGVFPNQGGGALNDMSYLQVTMHDTAGPYAHVYVHIVDASAHVADSNDTGWVALSVNAGIYDLLELQNGIDTVLANSTALPAGYMSQLRLVLGDSNSVVLADSVTTYPLQTPSAQQSGLKINVHHTLEANVQNEIIIDFDANKSIVQKGNGGYLLKPVIKVDTILMN